MISGVRYVIDIRGDRGLSDFGATHRWVLSGSYDLPYNGNNRLAQGWELATIVQLPSGNPINFVPPTHRSPAWEHCVRAFPDQWMWDSVLPPMERRPASPTSRIRACFIAACRATRVAPARMECNSAIWAATPSSARGSPSVDLALVKNTKITGRITWQIRADAFDLLNHSNFSQTGASAADTLGGATFASLSPDSLPATPAQRSRFGTSPR